jgi:hypothetical protein
MKLSEIKALQEMHSTSEVTIEKWEGHEPDGEYVKPFDVLIPITRTVILRRASITVFQ